MRKEVYVTDQASTDVRQPPFEVLRSPLCGQAPPRTFAGRRHRLRTTAGWRFLLAVLAGAAPLPAAGQETADYFKKSCANCHYIGGGRHVGPDLKDIDKLLELKGREWVVNFIRAPEPFLAGDDYARKLLADYSNIRMTVPADLTAERAESLLKLVLEEAKKERSTFARGESRLPKGPFTESQIADGRDHFQGLKSFQQGGVACVSCHTVEGVAFGGGRLGPDLTPAFNKYRGREGLLGWLSSPPTPTMQPIYKNHPFAEQEIVALIAYLENAREGREEAGVARLNFFLLGLGGAAGGLVVFDYLWRRRFRSVRRVLVHPEEREAA